MTMGQTLLEFVTATFLGVLFPVFLKYFLAWQLPRNAGTALLTTLHDFRQASSDSERQSLAMQCARHSFHLTFILSLSMALATLLFLMVYFILDQQAFSVQFMSATTIIGMATWYLLERFKSGIAASTPGYGIFSRLLHHAVLDFKRVRKSTFNFSLQQLESKATAVCSTAKSDVLVMGMARSGTSLVLRLISEDKTFNVLRYKDMPFVLAPVVWRKVSRFQQKPIISVERFHRDGLLNNSDSPEAFEEVYWETFRSENCVVDQFDNKPNVEALENFEKYKDIVRSIGNIKPSRYLSKNNNSLIRMDELAANAHNIILIVYREPGSAAASMHRTHTRFCDVFKNDKFAKSYFNWLAHFEFGPMHKPFHFAKLAMSPKFATSDLDYWLDYWCAVHQHILDRGPKNSLLLNYDRLCSRPQEYLEVLQKRLNASFETVDLRKIAIRFPEQINPFNDKLLSRAKSIYAQLLNDPRNLHIPHEERLE